MKLTGKGYSATWWGKALKNIYLYFQPNYADMKEGFRIYLHPEQDYCSYWMLLKKTWDEQDTEVLKRHIKKGDVVVDIGANIGYYSLLFSKLVGETGKVISVEPAQNNFDLLYHNIHYNNSVDVNNFYNISLFHLALSDKKGVMRLYINEYDYGGDSLYCEDKSKKFESVVVDKLDNILSGRVDLVKMDVEGAEKSVILGMKEIIKQNPNVKIMIEHCPFMFNEWGVNPNDCIKMLKEMGYSFYDMHLGRATTYEELLEDYPIYKTKEEYVLKNKQMTTNLLCIKNE